MSGGSIGKTHAAFAGAVLIGGANYIAVSLSNSELPPLFGAAFRFGLASALFFLLAAALRVPRLRGRGIWGAAAYGAFGFGAAYGFLYYALTGMAAGAVAVVVATSPLVTLALAVCLRQERLSARGLAGAALAVAGIAALSSGSLGGGFDGSHLAAAVLGTLAVAASSVVAKAFPDAHPLRMNALGMTAGTLLLTAGSLAFGERWALPRESRTWLAVGWLVLLGSLGLFQLFLYVVRRWTASAAVYAVAAMPVIAMVLGAILLDQPVTARLLAGGVLVGAAVYVGALAGKKEAAQNPG